MIFLIVTCGVLAGLCLLLYLRLKRSETALAEETQRMQLASSQLATHATNYHQKLRALSDSSGAGMIILDHQAKIVHTNATAERILGVGREDVVGHSLIQATLSVELQEFVLRVAASGKPASKDFQMPGPVSRVLRASVHSLAVGLLGVPETMLVLVDVTELHRLETIRRDFVANVSHELRTPLASIRAIAETLHEGALHDEEVALGFLETIIRETDRLGRISKDLLVLADAESKDPVKDWFNIAALLREVVGRSQSQAQQAGLTLKLSVPDDLPLFASRDQMEQVVVNLVDNAIKYTGKEGTVCVLGSIEDDKVVIQVNDTGIGIMLQDLPRIFERFYRVDRARSRESGGTGLGLSIVKNIVEAHGGEVKVVSEFNRGSNFTIILPNLKEL